MSPLVACLLVLVVLGLAAYFAVQQAHTLRNLPRVADLSLEDQRYFRRQAWRRLVGCGLLVSIGTLIAWSFLGGLEHRIDAIAAAKAAQDPNEERPLDPEQKQSVVAYSVYVIGVLVLLLFLVIVAALDVWAIRGYGVRHYRRIQDDRRAMIQRQLVQLRRERGHHRNGPSNN